jgi:hypothetical protein
MLATGRRVLVVSHGETALTVIRDQLPEGVRDLAISVTTSEREGLKQVEKAIGLMLSVVNLVGTDHARQYNLIRGLEANIIKHRKRLPKLTRNLLTLQRRIFRTSLADQRNPMRLPSTSLKSVRFMTGSRIARISHSKKPKQVNQWSRR